MTSKPLQRAVLEHEEGAIAARILPAGFQLHRLFRHPGGDFNPAPRSHRHGRLDPTRQVYGVLYTTTSVLTAAVECGVVLLEPGDPPRFAVSDVGPPPLQHATLSAKISCACIDLTDEATMRRFGIDPFSELDHLKPWRLASERIFSALRAIGESTGPHIVGICYRTQHRGSSALNVALLETHYESTFSRSVSAPFDTGSLDLERLCRPDSDESAV